MSEWPAQCSACHHPHGPAGCPLDPAPPPEELCCVGCGEELGADASAEGMCPTCDEGYGRAADWQEGR